jgi:hypothetical protein
MQQAIKCSDDTRTSTKLTDAVRCDAWAQKFEHFANPMVHPVTGETISSYKKLMNDLATAEV